jgi:hypothetical protein
VLAAGISRGLTIDAANTMTLGMWVDYIIEWNNLHESKDKKDDKDGDTVRMATQRDFDKFM